MDISSVINVVTTQRRRYYINLLMNVFAIMNVSNPQHRVYDDDYSMNVFNIINTLMVQLGTSCSFDSPGLARNEPTPGKRSQGDSTPSVLSFFCEGMLITRRLMANYSKKRNTYGVVPHKPYVNPG